MNTQLYEAGHPWELGENIVMAASAGTGKTYNLVGVLLYAMLLGRGDGIPVEPARILATTFSKRAAEEIRERVTHELALIAEGGVGSRYGALFTEPRARHRAKALSLRSHELRITTLHAYAVELLREHGTYVSIAPDFTLLDPQEEFRRLEMVASDTVEHFARARPDDLLSAIAAAGGLAELTAFVTTSLRVAPERARDFAETRAAKDTPLLESQFRQFVDIARALSVESARFGSAAREFVQAWDAKANDTTLESALTALFDVHAVGKKKAPSEEDWAEFLESLPGENKSVKAHVLLESYLRREDFEKTGTLLLEILRHGEAALAARAREQQQLSFSDVLVFARVLLLAHPRLALQIGGEFDACLLDEAQDTSPLQRDIVVLLWQNPEVARAPGSNGSLAHIRPNGLFVVGDRKQSIYGFRGADVAIFAEFALGIAGARARTALGIPAGLLWEPEHPNGRFLTLRENYRGEAPLLAAANALSAALFVPSEPSETFEVHYVPAEDDLEVPGSRVRASADASRTSRVTWLGLAPPSDQSDEAAGELFRSLIGPRRDAEIIALKVTELAKNTPLRNMAVLARSNAMLDHVAFALAQANIPYVASGRAFFAAREVQDAAAFLSLLRDPRSGLAAAQVLRGPYTALSDLTLLELTQDRGLIPILEIDPARISSNEERSRFVETQTSVRRLSALAERIGPADLLREGIRALHVESVLRGLRNGGQRVSNLRKFEQWLAKFRHLHTACNRIEFARTMSEAEAPTFSDSDDAVRLLTIHGSKGLSFPVVFLPELGKRASPFSAGTAIFVDDTTLGTRLRSSRGHWMESTRTKAAARREVARQRADAQRVWYVAITRAEHTMYFAGGDDKAPTNGTLLNLLPALLERGLAQREDLRVAVTETVAETGSTLAAEAIRVKTPTPRRLPLAPTALADFVYCPRRFALANLWRVPEGRPLFAVERPSVDPREKGTAMHKVLEHIGEEAFGATAAQAATAAAETYARFYGEPEAAEGRAETDAQTTREVVLSRVGAFLSSSYARELGQKHARIFREVPFRIAPARAEIGASLRGTIDMIALYPDGSLDVIDYKSGAGPSLAPYTVQLRIYARAAKQRFPEATTVRTFAVFLGGNGDPVPLVDAPFSDDEWIFAATKLARAQAQQHFPRVSLPDCRAIRCGYVPRCHGDSE